MQTLDEVKASGRYRHPDPERLVAEVRDSPDYCPFVLPLSLQLRQAPRMPPQVPRIRDFGPCWAPGSYRTVRKSTTH